MDPARSDLERVKSLLGRVCAVPPEAISDDALLIACGLDSMRALDFILAVEETFGIEVADDAAARLKTVADVAAYIRRELVT